MLILFLILLSYTQLGVTTLQLPDLTVSKIWTEPAKFKPGEEIKVCFTVLNKGDACGSFHASMALDASFPEPTQIVWNCSGLAAGDEISFCYVVRWPDDLELHKIRCMADLYDEIEEANEDNNILVEEFAAVNEPPNKPYIEGQTWGEVDREYYYIIWAIDPDGNNVRYHIEWGDGKITLTSFKKSGEKVMVAHTWHAVGKYTIKAKAIDEYGAESEWAKLYVTIGDEIPPYVIIIRPKDGLYIFDKKVLTLKNTIIIGGVTIKANASDNESGISNVEFYIDDALKYVDDSMPYEWLWDERAIGEHIIKVVAYDKMGNKAMDGNIVCIINL